MHPAEEQPAFDSYEDASERPPRPRQRPSNLPQRDDARGPYPPPGEEQQRPRQQPIAHRMQWAGRPVYRQPSPRSTPFTKFAEDDDRYDYPPPPPPPRLAPATSAPLPGWPINRPSTRRRTQQPPNEDARRTRNTRPLESYAQRSRPRRETDKLPTRRDPPKRYVVDDRISTLKAILRLITPPFPTSQPSSTTHLIRTARHPLCSCPPACERTSKPSRRLEPDAPLERPICGIPGCSGPTTQQPSITQPTVSCEWRDTSEVRRSFTCEQTACGTTAPIHARRQPQ
jgi:hypothetical protein